MRRYRRLRKNKEIVLAITANLGGTGEDLAGDRSLEGTRQSSCW
ncbi:hypothetical protein [Geobacillus icigianus]|nr:hypothetical protein [Geobacillus icigianus]